MSEKKPAKKPTPKTPEKKPTPKPKAVDLITEEKRLQDKYPDRKIIKGSMKDAGTISGFENKRTVEIKCARCPKTRRIATSDLHQVGHCPECIQKVRLERRRTEDNKKPTKKKPETKPTATTKSPTKPAKGPTPKTKPRPAAKRDVKVSTPVPTTTDTDLDQDLENALQNATPSVPHPVDNLS